LLPELLPFSFLSVNGGVRPRGFVDMTSQVPLYLAPMPLVSLGSAVKPTVRTRRQRRRRQAHSKLNANTWNTKVLVLRNNLQLFCILLLLLLYGNTKENHTVVSSAPRIEHVHPRAIDAAETPVILRL
jgi:hypothetical protein